MNTANWDVTANAGDEEEQQEGAEDKMWMEFQTLEETKRKQVCLACCGQWAAAEQAWSCA